MGDFSLKRIFDLGVALPVYFAISPLIFLLVSLILLCDGPPVFFRQVRPGKEGRPFTIYKYRTMKEGRDSSGWLLPDKKRLTRLGKFLRRTSLDELPELINVLKGDMSLVGPRPLLMQYLNRYTPEQARRHEVRPGITGWAQINGRNAIAWNEKFKLDLWYVENQSFTLDIKILSVTLKKVLKREGINQSGQATVTEFIGSLYDEDGGINSI